MLSGCASAQPARLLTQPDNGQTVTVPLGTTIMVQLAANPTTGYNWTPVSVTVPVLTLTGSSYTPDRVPSGVVGSGGMDTFRFRAFKTGQQQLRLNYARPWETNVHYVEVWLRESPAFAGKSGGGSAQLRIIHNST